MFNFVGFEDVFIFFIIRVNVVDYGGVGVGDGGGGVVFWFW